MEITLSIDDDIFAAAREQAVATGTSVDRMVSDYLAQVAAGKAKRIELWDEFVRLSYEGHGNSNGWKFNRDEIHERR